VSKYFKDKDFTIGEEVEVDRKHGKPYVAKIIDVGEIFATIEAGGKQWDIVINRLDKIVTKD